LLEVAIEIKPSLVLGVTREVNLCIYLDIGQVSSYNIELETRKVVTEFVGIVIVV
jgi:hypothetical protein